MNAYLCLVLADEICYGISSLGLEAKDCETAISLQILLWIKKALTIRFVFWFSETSQLSNLSIDTIVAVNAPYMV